MTRLTLTAIPAFVLFVLAAPVLAAEAPVAVSPGNAAKLAVIGDACPTLSWTASSTATSYELVIYAVGESEGESTELLSRRLPGGATSWTPALDSCLARGGRYAWSVRAVGGRKASEWSAPSLFEVSAGPSAAEFEEAVEVVRSYLAAGSEQGGAAQAASAPEGSEAPEPVVGGSPGASAAPATTQLSVDGNIDATSFTGDGESLSNVATDGELATHTGGPEAHFDHADSLAELNTQIGASLADGKHTWDATCLDPGVTCNFAASTSEGGAATTAITATTVESGDSATSFFSTGQIEEPRIADEIARDAEVFPPGGGALRLIQCASANGWRYYDLGDGTVLDCNTGKMWLKDASCLGLDHWTDTGDGTTIFTKVADLNSGTQFSCSGYTAGAYTDWEVPTISELCSAGAISQICPAGNASDSLIDSSVSGSPKVVNAKGDAKWSEGDAFVGVPSAAYWSATESDASNAWTVFLGGGNVFTSLKVNQGRIWPVRGGQ